MMMTMMMNMNNTLSSFLLYCYNYCYHHINAWILTTTTKTATTMMMMMKGYTSTMTDGMDSFFTIFQDSSKNSYLDTSMNNDATQTPTTTSAVVEFLDDDNTLLMIVLFLFGLALFQHINRTKKVLPLLLFSRPHPVPYKQLPKRPIITISFKPDDDDHHHHTVRNNTSTNKNKNKIKNKNSSRHNSNQHTKKPLQPNLHHPELRQQQDQVPEGKVNSTATTTSPTVRKRGLLLFGRNKETERILRNRNSNTNDDHYHDEFDEDDDIEIDDDDDDEINVDSDIDVDVEVEYDEDDEEDEDEEIVFPANDSQQDKVRNARNQQNNDDDGDVDVDVDDNDLYHDNSNDDEYDDNDIHYDRINIGSSPTGDADRKYNSSYGISTINTPSNRTSSSSTTIRPQPEQQQHQFHHHPFHSSSSTDNNNKTTNTEPNNTSSSSWSYYHDLLPDSFAPLLSSSFMEINTDQICCTDLIHAVRVSAIVKLRAGIHEVPLDKDVSRPQLRLNVPPAYTTSGKIGGGCKISASIDIGSDGLTREQDFDCTTTRNFYSHSTTSEPISTSSYHEPAMSIATSSVAPSYVGNKKITAGATAAAVGGAATTTATVKSKIATKQNLMKKSNKIKNNLISTVVDEGKSIPIYNSRSVPTNNNNNNNNNNNSSSTRNNKENDNNNNNNSNNKCIRSKPMVKHGKIGFDPPLALSNVAPTLIHVPTLFDDLQYLPLLRNIMIIRYIIDWIISISNYIERCLWIIESKMCQIHLSQVKIQPLYKGSRSSCSSHITTTGTTSNSKKNRHNKTSTSSSSSPFLPEWRLSLSFSGHVLLFGYIPIPFVNVVLPTFIIPQPHALLEYLLSAQPLASARLRRENIAEQRIALAAIGIAESWKMDLKLVATPPVIGVDLTLPGGLAVALEVGLWRDHQPGGISNGPVGVGGRISSTNSINPVIVGGPPPSRLGHDDQRQQYENEQANRDKRWRRNHSRKGFPAAATTSSVNYQNNHNLASVSDFDDGEEEDNDPNNYDPASDLHSMSSWTTNDNNGMTGTLSSIRNRAGKGIGVSPAPIAVDANKMIPWTLEFSAKGSLSHEKMSFHILKLEAKHSDYSNPILPIHNKLETRGSMAIWKHRSKRNRKNEKTDAGGVSDGNPLQFRKSSSLAGRWRQTSSSHPELETEDTPSVAAVLMFPDETASYHSDLRMLQYDYVFDIFDDSKLDAVTVSVGATHPMLNGGTMVTTILDSIYAFGSLSAREDAILDPNERRRKRNILRHLPATDFTFGIQNIFIPPESNSYSDDGQTLFIPELHGGRMMIHLLGGFDPSDTVSVESNGTLREAVSEGIKVVADFEFASCTIRSEGNVKEFPELDIFPDDKLRSFFSGTIVGSGKAHLRPQQLLRPPATSVSTIGPNVFNPLEAYEIEFSRSSLTVKVKEYSTTLGHRRIMFPAESTFLIQVTESIVDMGFEGKTKCDLCWDFQGLSPILQVTKPGLSPETALPENKEQVTLLVAPLRQGRFSLNVSSVGGISITKAATSREDREGLYDWKFFNALISPDAESAGRIMDVLHDKRTMDRMLQVAKLLNSEVHKMLEYGLQQIWRVKEILDQEGVSDPRHAIPMYKMARLVSLLLAGNDDQIETILPIIRRVVDGDGVDVVQIKGLLRDNIDSQQYDLWAAEIDRAVRFLAIALGPASGCQPYVEEDVIPLAELPYHAAKLRMIPSASQLYAVLQDKPQLPLDPSFSKLISRVAPYLTFPQIEYILQVRTSSDWQPSDLRRVRYVYSVKRKVLEIAESYGGLSFLPQSFFLSVFLGEATRTSLRASDDRPQAAKRRARVQSSKRVDARSRAAKVSTLSRLRRRRLSTPRASQLRDGLKDPLQFSAVKATTGRVAPTHNSSGSITSEVPSNFSVEIIATKYVEDQEDYELSDSLLGPQDVAILLQAGLTSVMKGSTVVQLNQRMLLNLICSQPHSFAVAVLAEIGTSTRSLTSALMALVELDQTAFKSNHQIDMHALLESWLPGIKIPRREDYMAGGRFARQSYYGAIFAVSKSILDDAESYLALKHHLQYVRNHSEQDPIPQQRERTVSDGVSDFPQETSSKLMQSIAKAKSMISEADSAGNAIMASLLADKYSRKREIEYEQATSLYRAAWEACAAVLSLDKHSFYSEWFRDFYQRNYDALQIKSVYDNVIEDIDRVRYWIGFLWKEEKKNCHAKEVPDRIKIIPDNIFEKPDPLKSQLLVDAIIESLIYERSDREKIRNDPLVRLLIPNPPGFYDFVIISAAGVVTEGKNGTELKDAFERLEKLRGVKTIRADTATARSLGYNAGKIEEAIEVAVKAIKKPYGLLGYSQGCANALMAESMLLSGSPKQQGALFRNGGLVCRQLLFSASNGSFHAPAMDRKVQNLITLSEDFFKSQAGYFSRAFASSVLEALNSVLDSAHFHKLMGGAQSFLEDGCRAFWREAQHLSHVPTCTIRGVMEDHTTPECLEMLSHMLTKQSGSHLHDSQVHVYDAVGHPVYHRNRNARVLKQCDVGAGAIQRTHHWSPLHDEVDFLTTPKDIDIASFDCAKDRHVFPWVDVNVRFGFIKYLPELATCPGEVTLDGQAIEKGKHQENWEDC